jgi:hypothetical protein
MKNFAGKLQWLGSCSVAIVEASGRAESIRGTQGKNCGHIQNSIQNSNGRKRQAKSVYQLAAGPLQWLPSTSGRAETLGALSQKL